MGFWRHAELPALITFFRLGKPNSKDDLVQWLYEYVEHYVSSQRHKLWHTIDPDDISSGIMLHLIEHLDNIFRRIDLQQNPCGYLYRVVANKFLDLREAAGKAIGEQDNHNQGDLWHETETFAAVEYAAAEELRLKAKAAVERVAEQFRFPRFRRAMRDVVNYWLATREESIPSKQGRSFVPEVVRHAMRYHLRKATSEGWVQNHASLARNKGRG